MTWRSSLQRVAGIAVAVCTAAIVAAAMPAAAQPAPAAPAAAGTLSLADAVHRALAQHPSPDAARAAASAARAAFGEARAAWWPAVRLQASATQFDEPALVVPLHGFTPGNLPVFDETVFQGSVVAGWTVFDGGARGARIRRADAQLGGAEAGLDGASQALVARTVAAFLEVRTRAEVLEAQDRRYAALDAERDRVERRLGAGRAARVELLRVEAALARADAERVETTAAARTAIAELGRLVGIATLPALAGVALADTAVADRAVLLASALGASPALEQARAQQAGAHAGAKLARAARWPELRAQGAYQGWSDDEGHDALEWNVALQLAYPIFTGGATRHAVERADADRRGADAVRRDVELQVAADLDRALQRVVEARARVHSLGVAVLRSSEVARIETLALDAGSGTQTDWLGAQADLLEARAGLVEARHGEIAARAELARVVGALDPDWIARTLETTP
jgi:cobalt-zinc-cadmium efflux system outer membrane protein